MGVRKSNEQQPLDDSCIEDVLAVYDFISDAMVWIKDSDFRYRWVNRTFLLNFSFAEVTCVIGLTDHDFTPVYLADL